MADEVLKRDDNRIVVLGGITDDINQYITMLRVDPTTKRLKVSAIVGSSGLTVGTTTIASGTDKGILYNNSGVLGEYKPSASLILATDASKNVVGLDTATYPSLTELSYVKGVTSAIQTQLGNKQASNANLTSLAGLTYASTAFVKMTGANTFALDTNTYLTSLSGAVLTDQSTPQTIGLTGSRLAKLWATDIETTNMPTVGGVAILSSLTAPQFTTIELGHATANTLSASGGVLSIESVVIPTISSTNTLTNKRITKRVASTTDDATAVIDSDSYDEYYLTAVANATEISVSGTPTNGQTIFIGLKDTGSAKALTWTGITALGVTLPTTTVAGKQHIIGIKYIASAWRAIAVSVEA